VEDISNWYVRRSRRRFWDGDEGAFFVLWRCLVDVSKLLAPLIPFVTDEIYNNLDGSEPSVHLCDYPLVDDGLRDGRLERDVQVVLQPLEGYRVERSGTQAVALNLELDDDLRREGLAREAVHAIQAARKQAGLEVEDRISLTLSGDPALLEAVRAHEGYVAGETLATSVTYDGTTGERVEIEGRPLAIAVTR